MDSRFRGNDGKVLPDQLLQAARLGDNGRTIRQGEFADTSLITLYELHWPHYCEKVRWALRLKNVEWRSVNINAFSKQELLPFAPGPSGLRLVPMIHDERTGRRRNTYRG